MWIWIQLGAMSVVGALVYWNAAYRVPRKVDEAVREMLDDDHPRP